MRRAVRRLLSGVLARERVDDVLGDLEERYARLAAARGRAVAGRWYLREALLLCLRPSLLRLPALPVLPDLTGLRGDVRFALRMVLRDPVTSLAIVLTLGVAIGGATAVFGAVDRILVRMPPGVAAPERVVEIYREELVEARRGAPGYDGYMVLSLPAIAALVEDASTLDGVAAISPGWTLNAVSPAGEERVSTSFVTADYFTVLGARAAHGRSFDPATDGLEGGAPVAVLSHRYWTGRFDGDPHVLGQTIRLEGREFTVVGVAQRGFVGTSVAREPDIWLPVSMMGVIPRWGIGTGTRAMYVGVARLRDGVGYEGVAAELDRLGREFYAATGATFRVAPLSHVTVDPNRRGAFVNMAVALGVGIAAILLIACLNVAGILLARSAGRRRELAVRSALGAGRGRRVRQLLAESTLLFVAGAAVGVGLLVLLRPWLARVRSPDRFFFSNPSLELPLDLRVLAFALVATAVSAAVFGAVPALRASRTDPHADLSVYAVRGGVARLRLRDALVALQVAFCLVALAGAGLFLRALHAARTIDPGFDADRVGMVSVSLHHPEFTRERHDVYYRRALDVARAVPGVERAAFAQIRPLAFESVAAAYSMPDALPDERFWVRPTGVTQDYFETLGIPIVAGRGFLPSDDRAVDRSHDERHYVIIVNQRTAELAWPGEPIERVVGRRIYGAFATGGSAEIVGVVPTTRQISIGETPAAAVYTFMDQLSNVPLGTLFVRTRGRPESVLAEVAARVRRIDPAVPVYDVEPARALVDRALWGVRAGAGLLTGLGVLGAFLAALGVYGIVASMVGERRREMGIRIALGALRGRVYRLIVGRAMAIVLAGSLLGLAVVLAAGRTMTSLLYGVPPSDPPTLAAVCLVLLGAALLAAHLPASGATRVDPLEVLRDG